MHARTFGSQNVQSTPASEHFWKLRCSKNGCNCGAKHISKWQCQNHIMPGPHLEVEMSKKRTSFLREAHLPVKMCKAHYVPTTLEVEMLKKCTPLWRKAHVEVKMLKTHQNTTCSDHFSRARHRKSARGCGPKYIWKSKC